MTNEPTKSDLPARVTLTYDAFGNRIERVGWDGTTTVERYEMDGADPAEFVPGETWYATFGPDGQLIHSGSRPMPRAQSDGPYERYRFVPREWPVFGDGKQPGARDSEPTDPDEPHIVG